MADEKKGKAAIEKDGTVTLDNMHLWDQVSKTLVEHTKEVTFGRRFTAIDAHSQIMEATRLFGPIGQGWGYDTVFGFHQTARGEDFVWCDLKLWYYVKGDEWEGNAGPTIQKSFGPIRGLAVVQGYKADGKPKTSDHDAAKKAMTDALTKSLSHLGFNADVFLGKFDDNKYVDGLKKEQDKEAGSVELAYQQDRQKFIDAVKACTTKSQIEAVVLDWNMWMARLSPGIAIEMVAWSEKRKSELK